MNKQDFNVSNPSLNISKKKYFITGATGYLGSNLVKRLLSFDVEINCLKRSTSNTSRLIDFNHRINWINVEEINFSEYFKNSNIDVVIHCATHYGRREIDPIATIESNLILPLKILHAACSGGTKTFINTDTILDKRINDYTLSKSQFLEWLKVYSGKLMCFNVALEHFYGPGDDDTKFVTHLIRTLLKSEKEINLTSGLQKRDFIYIDDVINAFVLIINHSFNADGGFHKYEIGTGKPIKLREFVSIVKRLSANSVTNLNFGAIPYRSNEVMNSEVNNKTLLDLGWSPTIDLNVGLMKTIEVEKNDP